MPRGRRETRFRSSRRQHRLTPTLRQRIIDMHLQDHLGATKITQILRAGHEHVTRPTVQRLLTRFNRTGEVLSRAKGGCHPDQRHPQYVRDRVVQIALDDSERTVDDIRKIMNEEYKDDDQYIPLPQTTVRRILHEARLSTKLLRNPLPKLIHRTFMKHGSVSYM